MTLTVGDYAAIVGILSVFVGIPNMWWLFSFRGVHARIGRVEKGVEKRLSVVDTRIEELDKGKTDKASWAREVLQARRSTEEMGKQLTAIATKLDANVGMVAVANRIAEEIGKLNGRG